MGDHQDWSPEPNGTILDDGPSYPSFSPPSSPNLPALDSEFWPKAEEAAREIIALVQPTVVSDERRRAVIDYVQRLINSTLGCEVYPFGSVPLKTYLPDGDIDLTSFGKLNFEEALASDVCSVLEREDLNGAGQFVVKDVQLIRAEVKLVKCLVQNIVVDISFNQLGGLCTLCFLEKVDCLIGKDHLFKRSIILIKAWCYYESRILGAHHGLISTYALETLVLYIFHLFHSSLDGPLAVLFKFLDYFSNFDWDKYCISLNGPIRLASLPEFVVETPENGGRELLLTQDFLRECMELYSVPPRGFEANLRSFPSKHLNIVDPLKENNNLGRSVSKGNFYRIRSAFTYGARKLGRVLSLSEDSIAEELQKFFANTLDRHGSGQRPDVQEPVRATGHNGNVVRPPVSVVDLFPGDHSDTSESSGLSTSGRWNNEVSLSVRVENLDSMVNNPDLSRSHCSSADADLTENHLSGDAKDLATTKMQNLSVSRDEAKSSPRSPKENDDKIYLPPLLSRNGATQNGTVNFNQPENSESARVNMASFIPPHSHEDMRSTCDGNMISHAGVPFLEKGHHLSTSNSIPWTNEAHYSSYSHPGLASGNEGPDALNQLSDLSGDYNNQLSSLQYGRRLLENAETAFLSPISSPFLSQFQCNNPSDFFRRSVPFSHLLGARNANGVVTRQFLVPVNTQIVASMGFGMEDVPKPRGTGTYFPNASHYRDRPYSPRGRHYVPARSPRNNGRPMVHPEGTFSERGGRNYVAQAQLQNQHAGEKSGPSGFQRHISPQEVGLLCGNGSIHPSDAAIEFGSTGNVALSPSALQESGREANNDVNHHSPRPKTKSSPGVRQDRISEQTYRLKDEEDFPPLSI